MSTALSPAPGVAADLASTTEITTHPKKSYRFVSRASVLLSADFIGANIAKSW